MHIVKRIVPHSAERGLTYFFPAWILLFKIAVKLVVVHRASPLLDLVGWVEIAYNDDAAISPVEGVRAIGQIVDDFQLSL